MFEGGRRQILNPEIQGTGRTVRGLICSRNPEPLVLLKLILTQADSQNIKKEGIRSKFTLPTLYGNLSLYKISDIHCLISASTPQGEILCFWASLSIAGPLQLSDRSSSWWASNCLLFISHRSPQSTFWRTHQPRDMDLKSVRTVCILGISLSYACSSASSKTLHCLNSLLQLTGRNTLPGNCEDEMM